MRYLADELYYEQIKIFGKEALFSDVRIQRESVPEELIQYEVRHDDEGGTPTEVAKGILVNFFGTLLVKGGLHQLEEEGNKFVGERDWSYTGDRSCTLEEYLRKGDTEHTYDP